MRWFYLRAIARHASKLRVYKVIYLGVNFVGRREACSRKMLVTSLKAKRL